MKWMSLRVMALAFIISCTKEKAADQFLSGQELKGTWVEKTMRFDTLVAYQESDRPILFDNSLYYRTSFAIWPAHGFEFEYELNGDQIGTRAYDAQTSTGFHYVSLVWLKPNQSFQVEASSFRPYMDPGDSLLVYERVK